MVLINKCVLQFGMEDLKALPNQTSCWDGVRNYQVPLFERSLLHLTCSARDKNLGCSIHKHCFVLIAFRHVTS